MSLDVYLRGKMTEVDCLCTRCGLMHTRTETEKLYSANITHHLTEMAEEAGIYKHVWRPEDIGMTKAGQLIEPLRAGLTLMRADPSRFAQFNAKNGWGTCAQFIPWIERYLQACEENPEADIVVSR